MALVPGRPSRMPRMTTRVLLRNSRSNPDGALRLVYYTIVLEVHSRRTIMADDTNLRSGQDRARINLSQDHEVRYWIKTLGVTEDELRAAVQQVGSSADRVREHI